MNGTTTEHDRSPTKRIDILYFEGCPHHLPAVEMVKNVVDDLSLDAEIHEVEVHGSEDAFARRFLGSPSIQVDGVDIEPAARERTDYGFSCRTYSDSGLPARSMLVAALDANVNSIAKTAEGVTANCCGDQTAAKNTPKNWGLFASTGSVFVAMTASACCWLPLVFIAFGLSAGGLGAAFDTARPYMLAASVVLLSIGFYFVYRKPKCEPGSACETPDLRSQRLTRGILWTATLAVALFASLPLYIGVFLPESGDVSADTIDVADSTIGFHVDGMTCEACAFTLRDELVRLEGIADARIAYKTGRVDLVLSANSTVRIDTILETIRTTGFQGKLMDEAQEDK